MPTDCSHRSTSNAPRPQSLCLELFGSGIPDQVSLAFIHYTSFLPENQQLLKLPEGHLQVIVTHPLKFAPGVVSSSRNLLVLNQFLSLSQHKLF